jgi:lipopolysaccharide biosynthesis regulator YciM
MSETPQSQEESQQTTRTYSAWFGFATRELTPHKSVRIRIRWGRVLAFFLILGFVGWFAKSWALYHFFKEIREFEDVAFMDMVLFPMNRSNVRVQQGNYQVEQAKGALEREDYRRAYSLLREGVVRSPANLEGRMLLAQIYAGWRPELASELLVDGIEHGEEDPDYVRLMCLLLLSQKEDAQLLELTEMLLAKDLPANIQQLIAVSRLQAAMLNGRFDIVRDVFETTDLEQTMDGLLLGTQLYQRTGQQDLAAQILVSALNSIPEENAAPLFRSLIAVFKQQGAYDKAREVALELVIRNPLEWQPRIALIDILSASDMIERRDREIEALLKEHRNDQQAMTALAQLSADYGNTDAAARLYEVALENGYSLSLFSLTLAEALIQDGRPEEAIELCNELIREDPSWMLNAESSFNAIRSLAYYEYGDPELGGLYLRNFLDSKRANSVQFMSAAKQFSEEGMDEQALALLQEAYSRDPKNEQLLAELINTEMNLGAFFSLNQHLEALFQLRRPDYELIESIHNRLQSDRFLYTRDREALLESLATIIEEKDQMNWSIWEQKQAG